MKASIRLDHQLLAVESDHTVHAMLELAAPPPADGGSRASLNLGIVIDRSGSMAGPKLEITKQCVEYLVRRLDPSDQLTLVTYDTEVQLLSALGPVDVARLEQIIRSIPPGGMTNLSGGWLKGREELARSAADDPKRLVLLTDGLANVGVTDHASLVGFARTAAGNGIGTTTIGFGEGFDEELLTDMANSGGGNSYYADSVDAAPGIFAEEFEGLMSLFAQTVSVEICPSQDVEVLAVLNEFPVASVPDGMQVSLGDAYGGERRRVVFQLRIPQLARLGVAKVADVVVRYTTVDNEIAAHELRLLCTSTW
jgi:Ca-activated chloride channel family protein